MQTIKVNIFQLEMEGFVLDCIFRYLSPNDLLMCMLVSREFCAYARTNGVWERHKRRVVKEIPLLDPLFANYATWYFFNTFLMGDIIQKTATTKFATQQTVLVCCLKYAFSARPNITIEVSSGAWEPYVLVILKPKHRKMKWENGKSNLWCNGGGEASVLLRYVYCIIHDKQKHKREVYELLMGQVLEYLDL